MRYRLKIFLALTSLLVAAVVAWQVIRDRGQADERAAWAVVVDSMGSQRARIDSLEAVLADFDRRVDEDKRQLDGAALRVRHYESRADEGRLPTPQYREYSRAIESHNGLVQRYNATLAEMQRTYAAYSALVDSHNAFVDSANAMQRRATQEGYALPSEELDRIEGMPPR
jgi:hypothetical protein